MKRLVKVKNKVARRPTLPGVADEGMIKPMSETNTMAAAGKKY